MTYLNEKISLKHPFNDYENVMHTMEKAIEEQKKRLILYIEWKGLNIEEKCFLKDIKTKNIRMLETKYKELAKTILKLKKKFDYFSIKHLSERVKDEEKDLKVVKIIPVKKKKRKIKKPVRKLKAFQNNHTYIVCTDVSSKEKEDKSVIGGIITLRNDTPVITYKKELKYNSNTDFLESLAILQMMKIAEMEGMEFVLFKTDAQTVFNNIERVVFCAIKNTKPFKTNDIINQIRDYLMNYPHWNLELVHRKEVKQAHNLCRSEIG